MKKEELKKIRLRVPADYYELGIKKNFFQKFWHQGKWQTISSLIIKIPQNVLDIGCASGWLVTMIAQKYPKARVKGLDVSEKMISYAKANHPKINFLIADAHQLPFPPEKFDLIICTEVLEHVVNPSIVLSEIKRCLTKDGEVVISMDTGSLLFRLVWYFWTKTKGRVWQNAHLHKIDVNKLKKLFKEADFKVKKEKYFNFRMAVAFQLEKRA